MQVAGVAVAPFLVMSTRTAAPTRAPEEVVWHEVPEADFVTLTTSFPPRSVFFAGSSEVDEDGIPDVDEQTYADCQLGMDGGCGYDATGDQITMRIPAQIERSAPLYLVVQAEWDVVSPSSPSKFNSVLASYAVLIQP
ncbi:hypothetical protein [Agrococcus sp. Ld7]|uniref:hypothetical protein n=1 Tax=Agrococcus sp. Ld7 TaxID=649148 RepID=UPI00386BA008